MKKLMIGMLMVLLSLPALAESSELALAALRAVYPEAVILASVADEDEAFYAIETAEDAPRRLCCFELANDGMWTMSFDSAKALRPAYVETEYRAWRINDTLDMTLEGDTLRIIYCDARSGSPLYTYTFTQTEAGWAFVELVKGEKEPETLMWRDGCIWQVTTREEQDGFTDYVYPPCPMPWLADGMMLETFDASAFPEDLHELSDEDKARVAAILAPDAVYISGLFSYPEATFLLDMPDGTRRFVAFAWENGAWRTTTSTPMPADAYCDDYHSGAGSFIMGFNDPEGIDLDEDGYAWVELCAYLHEDGRWYVDTIRDDWGEAFFYEGETLTDNWGLRYYGTPTFERDVTKVDWLNLPGNLDEAVAMMDSGEWGFLSGNAALNLTHLRTAPSQDASSLGRYLEGTPVRLLEKPEDSRYYQRGWYHVAVNGGEVIGWMYATVYDGEYQITEDEEYGWVNVTAELPIITLRTEEQQVIIYDAPDGQPIYTYPVGWDENVALMGVIEGGWYHVWNEYGYEFEEGFVRVSDCLDAEG